MMPNRRGAKRDSLAVQMMTGVAEAARHLQKENASLRAAIQEACDLLAERKYGSEARSPGHNARLVLERAAAEALPE
jgi:hypothetical protein